MDGAGLRMDGILALDFLDVVIERLHSSNNKNSPTQEASGNRRKFKEAAGNCWRMFNAKLDQLSNPDHVTKNANSSQCEAQLYIFEDNEAVIKMIQRTKSNNETRVPDPQSCSWLVVWQNQLGPNQICWHQTQIVDLLTKRSFTRDEWCNLFRLFNIMNFSSITAIFVHLKRQTPCRREFEKGRQEKSLRKRSRGLLIWFQETHWTRSNLHPQLRMLLMSRGIRSWIDEVISSSRASIPRELGCTQEYQRRGAQDVVRYNSQTDRGTIIRDPDCIHDDTHFPSLDEIYSVSWSSNQMGESKSACLLRCSLVFGKDAWSFRRERKVAKPDQCIPTRQRVCRIVWNWLRTKWVRVEYFSRTPIAGDLEDSKSTSVWWGSFVSMEAEHLSLSVGCARNKHQYLTVLLNQKSFRWMLDCEWMDYLLQIYFGCGDRSVTFIEQNQNTNQHRSRKLFAESQIQSQTKGKPRCWSINACGLRHHRRKFFSRRVSVVHLWRRAYEPMWGSCSTSQTPNAKEISWNDWWSGQCWFYSLKRPINLLIRKLCCMCLKTLKQWSNRSSRAEVQRWDTCQEPTELLLIGCSTESTWTPRSKSNKLIPKTISQTC